MLLRLRGPTVLAVLVTLIVAAAGAGRAAPPPPALSVSLAVSPSHIDLTQTASLNATSAGGVSPYSYAWSALPPGCTSANVSHLSCTPQSGGNFTVTVDVRDAVGATASASAYLSVAQARINFVAADPPFGVAPLTTNLTNVAQGGTPPYTYYWSFGDGTNSYAQNVNHTYVAPGLYEALGQFCDALGLCWGAPVDVRVYAPLSIDLNAAPGGAGLGGNLTFTVNVTGGAPPYTYAWTVVPPGCTASDSSTLVCRPGAAGYEVQVTVTDGINEMRTATLIVTFYNTTVPSPLAGLVPILWGASAVAAFALGLLAAFLALRRRRGPEGQP